MTFVFWDQDLLSGVAAAGVAFVGTWAARRWALRSGRLDVPTGRSSHSIPMPRTGGMGVLLGILVAAFVFMPVAMKSEDGGGAIVLVCGLFFLTGFADDLRRGQGGLSPIMKLALQVGAAAAVVLLGARFDGRPSGPWGAIDLGAASAAMTVLWFVAVVNVINFMDGIDGIVSVTCLVILSVAAVATTEASRLHFYVVAIGAVLGFAVWNAPRAKIFLGDGGSHLLGFLVAFVACREVNGWSWDQTAGLPWALAAAPLVPSIVDVGMELIHKVRHGIPLSQPNNDHLYQRLVKAGWSHFAVAIRYGVLAAVAAVLAGPVADHFGLVAALVPGAAILGLHLWTGARTARGVPRLGAAQS